MRFYYLDPGLNANVGHHADTCRAVTSELRRRGIDTLIAASVQLIPELNAEPGATPFFEFFTYTTSDEPISGWLTTFLEGVTITSRDLARLPSTTADDVVFLNSAQPVQLMAIVTWLDSIPADRRPRIVVAFGTDAGVNIKKMGDAFTFESVDPREDPRSVLYRYIGQNIPAEFRQHLILTTFDETASKAYAFITGYKTGVLPPPQQEVSFVDYLLGERHANATAAKR